MKDAACIATVNTAVSYISAQFMAVIPPLDLLAFSSFIQQRAEESYLICYLQLPPSNFTKERLGFWSLLQLIFKYFLLNIN